MVSVIRKVDKAYNEVSKDGSILSVVQPIVEIVAGMQLDAPIAVTKILGGDFSDDNIYDVMGVTPSYRAGYGTKKKKTTTTKRKTSKADMKILAPEMYEDLYGKGSDIYDMKQDLKAQKKAFKDELNNY